MYQSRSSDTLLRIIFKVPEARLFVERDCHGHDESGQEFKEKFPYLETDETDRSKWRKLRRFTPQDHMTYAEAG